MSAKRKAGDEGFSDSKKRKNSQKYKETYRQSWPCLESSKKGVHFVHCSVCVCEFTCIHGGRNDCKRHVESKQHKDYIMLKAKQKPITEFVHQPSVQQEAVTAAEVLMAEFICHMNLSLSTADTMCKLVQKMCPDSKIAKEMRCGRNKATAILHDLARMTSNELAERMRTFPFTISTDGSNDDTSKQFPLVIRTLDPTTRAVNSELLSIPICKGSATGENIFGLVEAELKSRDIPWSNCIALGSDNANVMIGHKKGVFAYMKEKQPNLYLSGCPLHLIHIAAKKAADVLPAVDDLLVDVYYFFNKSDKRKSEFRDVQDLCDLDQKRMIKHVCTRWLSIGRCVERLLANWDALKVYFKDQKDLQDAKKKQRAEKTQGKAPKHQKDLQDAKTKQSAEKTQGKAPQNQKDLQDAKTKQSAEKTQGKAPKHQKDLQDAKTKQSAEKTQGKASGMKASQEKSSSQVVFEKVYMEPSYAETKVESILTFVRSPTNRLYVLFLSYTLKVYDEILTSLQAEEPKIHVLRRSLNKLLRSLLVRFVKPSAIANKLLDQVEYHLSYNIKPHTELVIGESAKEFIANKSENHLKDSRIQEFYGNVVCYFKAACDYIKKKLPLNEPLLKHAEVVDVSIQHSAQSSSLLYFLDRFPCLLRPGVTKDTVVEQFAVYQSYDLETCVKVTDRIDIQWKHIGDVEDENQNKRFNELSEVMLNVLTIPHSSAHCERVFSTVRKNRTDQRSSLKDDTLQSLLTIKSQAGNFLEKEFSKDKLIRLKSAYYRSLKD